MIIGVLLQQPADYLDYDIDCTTLFNEESDAIAVSGGVVASVSPVGLTVLGVKEDDTTAKVWIGNGVNGVTYIVTVVVTTTAGRIKEDEFEVVVEEMP